MLRGSDHVLEADPTLSFRAGPFHQGARRPTEFLQLSVPVCHRKDILILYVPVVITMLVYVSFRPRGGWGAEPPKKQGVWGGFGGRSPPTIGDIS